MYLTNDGQHSDQRKYFQKKLRESSSEVIHISLRLFSQILSEKIQAGLLPMAFSFYDGGGSVHRAPRTSQPCHPGIVLPATPARSTCPGWPPRISLQSPNRPRHLDMMLPTKSCPRLTFSPNCSPPLSPLPSSPSGR